jgi:hypothetical protein
MVEGVIKIEIKPALVLPNIQSWHYFSVGGYRAYPGGRACL